MQLYNPTRQEINQDYNSRNYIVKACSTRSVADDVGEHMLRKCKSYGLVSLDYTDREEKIYGSYEAFKKAKVKESFNNKIEFLQHCMKQEAFGVKESIEKNASPEIAMNFKVKQFEQEIIQSQKDLEEVLAEIDKSDPKMLVAKADFTEQNLQFLASVKKKGRPFAKKAEVVVENNPG